MYRWGSQNQGCADSIQNELFLHKQGEADQGGDHLPAQHLQQMLGDHAEQEVQVDHDPCFNIQNKQITKKAEK